WGTPGRPQRAAAGPASQPLATSPTQRAPEWWQARPEERRSPMAAPSARGRQRPALPKQWRQSTRAAGTGGTTATSSVPLRITRIELHGEVTVRDQDFEDAQLRLDLAMPNHTRCVAGRKENAVDGEVFLSPGVGSRALPPRSEVRHVVSL